MVILPLSVAQSGGISDAYDSSVDTRYPYTGPEVPIGDWNDQTINGDGKGYPRLSEPPAVQPASDNATNNVNVISLSYLPNGIHIHYQTPFGLGTDPKVFWGEDEQNLDQTAIGATRTYERTPPCSLRPVTQCSEFFHEIQITGLAADTTYFYRIPAANGTTESQTLRFKTSRAAGVGGKFTAAVLNDMGYKHAGSTHKYLTEAISSADPIAFAWHGGDISYADDWGSYAGGDMSVIYESNWDIWQQWMSNITSSVPYMVMPGNHEATCTEGDGKKHVLTPYLNENKTDTPAPKNELTYYSCPVSQRNFTSYQHRFRMPGEETNGVSNFWYSFDYGLAHFISMDGETDFPHSPESPFIEENPSGAPSKGETVVMNSGPFGFINGDWRDREAYEQYQWLKKDLSSVDRTKTPWVFINCHRPMYAAYDAGYERHMRSAFEELFLEYGVDVFYAGHIHWYERTYPLTSEGKVDHQSVKDNNTYIMNKGTSITHIVNGMAGNVENHSKLKSGESLGEKIAVHDQTHFGFSKLTVYNESVAYSEFIGGENGDILDHIWLIKPSNDTPNGSNGSNASSSVYSNNKIHLSSVVSSTQPVQLSVNTTGLPSQTLSHPKYSASVHPNENSRSSTQPTQNSDSSSVSRSHASSHSNGTRSGVGYQSFSISSTAKNSRVAVPSAASGFEPSSSSAAAAGSPLSSWEAGQSHATDNIVSSQLSGGSIAYQSQASEAYRTVVSEYTTFCSSPTTFDFNGEVYTATGSTTITILNCPCTFTINPGHDSPLGSYGPETPKSTAAQHTRASKETQIFRSSMEEASYTSLSSTAGAVPVSNSIAQNENGVRGTLVSGVTFFLGILGLIL